jgi:C-terminal processing protease CtpA/Prc
MGFYGARCFITAVKPGSDAEAKGLKPGDEVFGWEKFHVTRRDLQKMEVEFLLFAPRSASTLLVARPGNAAREITVQANVRELRRNLQVDFMSMWDLVRDSENDEERTRPRWAEFGDLLVVELPDFEMTDNALTQLLGRIRKHKAVVLDLRGNPGGFEERLRELTSAIFDHEVKIAEVVARKPEKPLIAKPHSLFAGTVVVLIDSRSASAAELLARTVQLEKRGVVIGDVSSGSVMRAVLFTHTAGVDSVWTYGVQVSKADLLMSDGKSLEKVGVVPDEVVLPTQADLVAGRDPMLARAIKLAGGEVTPEKAGSLFPFRWPKARLAN